MCRTKDTYYRVMIAFFERQVLAGVRSFKVSLVCTRKAAQAVGHREPEISVDFSRPVIPAADPVLAFSGPRNSKAVVHLRKPVFLVEGLLSSVMERPELSKVVGRQTRRPPAEQATLRAQQLFIITGFSGTRSASLVLGIGATWRLILVVSPVPVPSSAGWRACNDAWWLTDPSAATLEHCDEVKQYLP